DLAPVAAEPRIADGSAVPRQRGEAPAGDGIPDPGRAVAARRADAAAVWAERGTKDGTLVAQGDSEARLAGGHVSDLGRVIVAGGQHPKAVGAECHISDIFVVAPELDQSGTGAEHGGDAGAVGLLAREILLQGQSPREPKQGADQVLVAQVMRAVADIEA